MLVVLNSISFVKSSSILENIRISKNKMMTIIFTYHTFLINDTEKFAR